MNFTQLKDFARRHKHLIPINTIIDGNHYHFDKLNKFFNLHPRYDERFPDGIKEFRNIQNNDGYSNLKNNVAWLVVGNDGNSFICSCNFTKSGKNQLRKLKLAMRNAIYPEISKFKRSRFIAGFSKCCYCDEVINKRDDVHVDHYDLKFNDIADRFIEKEKINYKAIKLTDENTDGSKYIRFEDSHMQAKFIAFHNANTTLRLSHISCNIKAK